MRQGQSAYLDLWRIAAAITVAFAHLSHPVYHPGGANLVAFGSDAVIVFFVISGFVISYAANRPRTTADTFVFDRASRLFSIAIPALILTVALDQTGWRLAPEGYAPFGAAPTDPALTALFALSFAGEWGFGGFTIGTNTPWWSLSYEVAYYALFFALVFLRGAARAAAVLGGALLFGPKILLLAPAWALGVWAERRLRAPAPSNPMRNIAVAVAALAIYAALAGAGVREAIMALTLETLGAETYWGLAHAKRFVWDWIIAGLFTIHLIAACRAAGALPTGAVGRMVKWAAGASFSLYLTHMPVTQFAYAVGREMGWTAPLWAVAALVIAVALLFAALFERPLPLIRARLRARRLGPA